MGAFIVRRLIQAAFVVVCVVTFVFFLIRVSGDPASLGVSLEENRTQEEIEAEYQRVKEQLGLDRHILIQYVLFWGRAARGNSVIPSGTASLPRNSSSTVSPTAYDSGCSPPPSAWLPDSP